MKPNNSKNNDPLRHWVKLKKDFIPGCGDTKDFIILGASWKKERGQELLCPPSVYTTFYVGLRADELGDGLKPHYHILFSTSYGLDRKQLDSLNNLIRRHSNNQSCQRDSKLKSSIYQHPSYSFTLASSLAPTVLFDPISCELTGAGFQKMNE